MKRGIFFIATFLLLVSPTSGDSTEGSPVPGPIMVHEGDAFTYKVEKLYSKVLEGDEYITNTVNYAGESTLHEGDEMEMIIASDVLEYHEVIGWTIKTEWKFPGGSFQYILQPVELYGLVSHTNWTHLEIYFKNSEANYTGDTYEYQVMDESETFGYTESMTFTGNDTYFEQNVEAIYDRETGHAMYLDHQYILKTPLQDLDSHNIFRLRGFRENDAPISFAIPFSVACLILIVLKKRNIY